MKRMIALCFAAVLLMAAVSCGTSSVNIAELKEKHPAYFEMAVEKGVEVYVWQMAENSYRCGMLSGTNRNKTQEEIWSLQYNSLSIEEARAILGELGIDKEDISIIPFTQPYSSYYYELDEAYAEKVKALFY